MNFILMHKKIEVARLSINGETGEIKGISSIYNLDHLPVGVKWNDDLKYVVYDLNEWWERRAIPAYRFRYSKYEMTGRPEKSRIMKYVTKSLGLCLSDHYWIRPENSDLKWEDVNFFDHDFYGNAERIVYHVEKHKEIRCPDLTTEGNLQKRWTIKDGERILVKAGHGAYEQEPFNEVIASRFMEAIGVDCVPYSLLWEKRRPYSVCPNFVTKDTELIGAYRLMKTKPIPKDMPSFYPHFVSCCRDVGLDAVPFLDRMLTVDYIIANSDRHFNNFGLLRNPETLEYVGFAPIYDSGASFYFDLSSYGSYQYFCKPFANDANEQIKLVKSLDWLSIEDTKDLVDDVRNTLSERYKNDEARINMICSFTEKRLETIRELKERLG